MHLNLFVSLCKYIVVFGLCGPINKLDLIFTFWLMFIVHTAWFGLCGTINKKDLILYQCWFLILCKSTHCVFFYLVFIALFYVKVRIVCFLSGIYCCFFFNFYVKVHIVVFYLVFIPVFLMFICVLSHKCESTHRIALCVLVSVELSINQIWYYINWCWFLILCEYTLWFLDLIFIVFFFLIFFWKYTLCVLVSVEQSISCRWELLPSGHNACWTVAK